MNPPFQRRVWHLAAGFLLMAALWGVQQNAPWRHVSPAGGPSAWVTKKESATPRHGDSSAVGTAPGESMASLVAGRSPTPAPDKPAVNESNSGFSSSQRKSSFPGRTESQSLRPDTNFGSPRAKAAELSPRGRLSGEPGPNDEAPPPADRDPAREETVRVPYASEERVEVATIPGALAPVAESALLAGKSPTNPAMTMDRMSNPSVREVAEAEVNRAADYFLAHLAGVTDDPADAVRQQRWLEAQEATDARLRASLGGHAWMALHRDANRPGPEATSNDGPLSPSSPILNGGTPNQAPVPAPQRAD